MSTSPLGPRPASDASNVESQVSHAGVVAEHVGPAGRARAHRRGASCGGRPGGARSVGAARSACARSWAARRSLRRRRCAPPSPGAAPSSHPGAPRVRARLAATPASSARVPVASAPTPPSASPKRRRPARAGAKRRPAILRSALYCRLRRTGDLQAPMLVTHRTRVALSALALSLSLGAPPLRLARARRGREARVCRGLHRGPDAPQGRQAPGRPRQAPRVRERSVPVGREVAVRTVAGRGRGSDPHRHRARQGRRDGADVLDAEVTIDGRATKLGRPETLDPGEHVVAVKRADEPAAPAWRRSFSSSTATRRAS